VAKNQKTIKIPLIISIALSLAIIILILIFTINTETLNKLSKVTIQYEYFGVAIFLAVLYWVLWGARMMVLANAMDKNVKIGLWESTKIIMANLFLAGITPAMAGGEAVRIYLLNKDGKSIGCSTAAVLGERLLDAIFVLIMIPIALFIFKDIKDLSYVGLGLTIGAVVFIIFIFFFIYAIVRPAKTKAFLIYLSGKLSRFSKKKDSGIKAIVWINKEVDNFHDSMYCFSGHKKALVLSSFLTVVFWLVGFLIPSFILMGLGLPPFFIESIAAQIILLVIILIPLTPGSAGIAEISLYGLYGVLIGTGTDTLIGVFIIIYRFITYYLNLIVGAIFQYRIFKSIASFSMDMLKKEEEQKPQCEP
jgi:uncharacterized protein (TIRG00374 family)